MMRILASLLFVFSIGVNYAQNEKSNREEFTLHVPTSDGMFYEEKVGATPYFVKDQILQIYPGEKIFIEVEVKKKVIQSTKVVNENLNPKNTIEIEITQQLKDGENQGMMLQVKNPFDLKLNYKALIFIAGGDKWIPTSIVPVQPKLMSIELWPDPIVSFVLSNWELSK